MPRPDAPRTAVLRDYPLRLWEEQNEYTDGLLREFNLLLIGERSGEVQSGAPGRLVELADSFTSQYGPLLQQISAERQAALDAGQDRMDSIMPMPEELPVLLEQVHDVMELCDDFCRSSELLMLPRPDHLVALSEWVRRDLLTQFSGGEPTPWPGPF